MLEYLVVLVRKGTIVSLGDNNGKYDVSYWNKETFDASLASLGRLRWQMCTSESVPGGLGGDGPMMKYYFSRKLLNQEEDV